LVLCVVLDVVQMNCPDGWKIESDMVDLVASLLVVRALISGGRGEWILAAW
jgi:hypothetical protein